MGVPSTRRTSLAVALAAIALAVVGVAAAIWLWTRSLSTIPSDGPLDQWGAPLQSIGMPADVGRPYSHGTCTS
jgi:hypothetical protein